MSSQSCEHKSDKWWILQNDQTVFHTRNDWKYWYKKDLFPQCCPPTKFVKLRFLCSDRHFSIYVVHHKFIFVSLYPHGICWFAVNFKFKKSFFGVQWSAKSRVPSWNEQWIINIHSKSLHEEVCILISISCSVVLNIHMYICVCPVCSVHVLTNSGENIGRYTKMYIWNTGSAKG